MAAMTISALSLSPATLSVARFAPSATTSRRSLAVRCEAAPEETTTTPSSPTPSIPQPNVPAVNQVSTKVEDVMAFGGPGPEIINGRLAMLGFVTAIGVELASGQSLSAQLSDNVCVSWFIFTTALFSAASLVPLFQGVSVESKGKSGFFNATAEVINGRAAMIGLVALAVTEAIKGSPLA